MSAERPVREPQRRLHRVRPRRLPVHLAGRQRRGGRSAQDRPEPERLVRLDPADRRRPPRRRQSLRHPRRQPRRRSKAFAHWAPEVYCIGLRNVWKFTFDRDDRHALGRRRRPEPLRDGPHHPERRQLRLEHQGRVPPVRAPAAAEGRPARTITPPLVEYPHNPTPERPDDGKSITGGYVYRGKALPELAGVYVYGDFDTGRIWGLREQDGKAVVNAELIDRKRRRSSTSRPLAKTPRRALHPRVRRPDPPLRPPERPESLSQDRAALLASQGRTRALDW